MTTTIQDLAAACGATIKGGDASALIHAAADITSAEPGQVTQLVSKNYQQYLKDCRASACIVAESFTSDEEVPGHLTLLLCPDPEISFLTAVNLLNPAKQFPPGIAPEAIVADDAVLADGVYIAPFAIINQQVQIGEHSQILAGAYIGNQVKIGKNCQIHPYAVIYDGVEIGDHVIIHAGAIIGADGFGYKFRDHRHIKVPQVGNVVIADHVEIGANTCIDRGALGSTVIGLGSKIDNLVQIGHNNKVGKHVIMCGQTGVSGSCHIEDYAILAGSAGIADHVTIGQGAVIMARSGVAGNVPAGSHYFGSPAKDKKTAYKEQVAISKLPDLAKKVKLMEEKLTELEAKLGGNI